MTRARPRTKKQKAATKTTDLLSGHVQRRGVCCGKPNCKCTRGHLHIAHYHVWRCGGVRYQQFIRRADVPAVQSACDEHRALQAELRQGRAAYRDTIRRARQLFSFLSGARKAGLI